jgi:hypothetical protein
MLPPSWVFFAQRSTVPARVGIFYSDHLQESIEGLFWGCSSDLHIIKAFHGTADDHQAIRDRFLHDHVLRWWYNYSEGLAAFIRDEALCHTAEARALVGRPHGLPVKWRPVDASSFEALRKRRREQLAPEWAKGSERFMLWAASEFLKEHSAVTPKDLYDAYKHHDIYDFKTICNRLSSLTTQGRLKCTDNGYVLTSIGRKVIELFETDHARKSVRSLRP